MVNRNVEQKKSSHRPHIHTFISGILYKGIQASQAEYFLFFVPSCSYSSILFHLLAAGAVDVFQQSRDIVIVITAPMTADNQNDIEANKENEDKGERLQ